MNKILILHWILSILIIIYTFFIRKSLDLFTLGISSFIFYTVPAFWGTTWTTQNMYFSQIHFETYIIIESVLIVVFLNMIFYDNKNFILKKYNLKTESYPNILGYFLIAFSYANLLFAIYRVGIGSFFTMDKTSYSETLNPYYSLAMWGSIISLTFGGAKKNLKIIFLSFIILSFSLYLGSRSRFIVGVLSFTLVWLNFNIKINIREILKYGLIIFLIGLFATVYRRIYPVIKELDFNYLKFLLTSKDFYLNKVFILPYEIYNVFSTLNIAIERDLNLGIMHLIKQIIAFFPLAEEVLGFNYIRFSKIIMNEFYPRSRYGMASNIWAEMYSTGRYALLYLFLFFWVYIIKLLNTILIRKKRISIFLIPYGVYIIFYIHRLSFSLVIGDFKYVLFIYFVTIIFYEIFIKPYLKIDHKKG